MNPLIGGSLIGAGASLVGNIVGGISQRKTNEMNYKINQMNNEFNERMMEKQMAWNEEMWNKQNEYNTASNQRKRLEEAGLNPQLMMKGGSAGTATSANSAQSAQAANSPVMQAYRPDFSSFVAAVNTYANNKALENVRSTQAGLNQKGIDWYSAEARSRINYNDIAALNQSSQRHLNWLNWDIGMQTMPEVVKERKLQNIFLDKEIALREAETVLTGLRSDYQAQLNVWFGPQAALDFTAKLVDISYTKQLTKESVSSEILNYAQAKNINIRSGMLEKVAQGMVDAINAENKDTKLFYQSQYTDKDGRKWSPWQMRARSMGLGNAYLRSGVENSEWYKQMQRNYIAQGYLNWLTDVGGLVMTKGMFGGRKPSASTHPRYD